VVSGRGVVGRRFGRRGGKETGVLALRKKKKIFPPDFGKKGKEGIIVGGKEKNTFETQIIRKGRNMLLPTL